MNRLLLITLLFFPIFSFSQNHNEIKLDAFGLAYFQVGISYEKILNKNLGIEVGLGYIFEDERLDTTDYFMLPPCPTTCTYGTLPFKKRAWQLFGQVKYYPFSKVSGDRLFFSSFIFFNTKPKIEQAYFDTYMEYWNEPDTNTPNAKLVIGASMGYKFLIWKQRLVIEPLLGMGIETLSSSLKKGSSGGDFYPLLKLNLGYRF